MALPLNIRERKDRRERREVDNGHLLTRYFEIPEGATLAVLNVEKGDALPDDANARIQEANIVEDKRGTGKLLEVVAFQPDTWVA